MAVVCRRHGEEGPVARVLRMVITLECEKMRPLGALTEILMMMMMTRMRMMAEVTGNERH